MKLKQTVLVLGTAALLQFTLVSCSFSAPAQDLPKKATEQTLEKAIQKLKQAPDTAVTIQAPSTPVTPVPQPPALTVQPSTPKNTQPESPVTAPVVTQGKAESDTEKVVTLDLTGKTEKPESNVTAQKKYHSVKKSAKSLKKAAASTSKPDMKPLSSDKIREAISRRKAMLARAALGFRGTPYVWGGSTPRAFDCSGFTQYLYRKHYGINLPHNARMQFGRGKPVSFSDLNVGDLVFFNTRGPLSHVGMYTGNGKFVHAANPRRGVRVDSVASGYYRKVYAGARRYR